MNTVIIASNNNNKIREFQEILGADTEVLSLNDVGFFGTIEENGQTFLENSLIKAKAISIFLRGKGINAPVYADDSGLEVEALGGTPGVYSARYSGIHGNDKMNRALLLNNMENVENRRANFTCVIVKYNPDDTYIYAEGKTFGRILDQEVGSSGFGYDCIFFSDDLQKSFGIATPEEKNSVSHRGRALQQIMEK